MQNILKQEKKKLMKTDTFFYSGPMTSLNTFIFSLWEKIQGLFIIKKSEENYVLILCVV